MSHAKPNVTSKAPPPKKQRRGRSTRTSPKQQQGVWVRMYRHGLGDCFLIRLPKGKKGDFFILIDCGVIAGTPNAKPLMEAVADDLFHTCGNHIDVLVITHEHWDHVSGFHEEQARHVFEKITFGEVWFAWTEDPDHAVAHQLRQQRAQRLTALWRGVHQMRLRLGRAPAEDRDKLDRAAEVLSFFGIESTDAPPEGLGAAAGAGAKTRAAMEWAGSKGKKRRYLKPGDLLGGDDLAVEGLRVFVLGPPTDLKQLGKDLPSKSGKETYEEEAMRLAASENALFGLGPTVDGATPASAPFDAKYRIAADDARRDDFFRDNYFGSDHNDADAWRRIDADWAADAGALALQLDSDTNNTSLALAFELADGRVLLFPGDAQVGNWESWHADSKGNALKWKNTDITAEMLLNRTVLYKVGHHGSHNATLRDKGLEMMTDPRLVALVPVDVYIAHEKKHWLKMPFAPLMSRLAEQTQGRVLQADADERVRQQSAAHSRSFAKQLEYASSSIEAFDAKGRSEQRFLYVDYHLDR